MDKVTISGQIIGSDGRPISRLIVSLVGDKHYRTKTNKKGAFKIKKVIGGDYYLMVSDKAGILHSEILTITGDLRDLEIKIGATFSKTPVPDYDDLISSVDFKINDNDQMVISFYFNPLEKEDIYNIEILVSDNNGKNWFSSKTVSGDVKKISGYGKKEVIWDVFSDVDELEGDVIIEVVASLVND